MPMPLAFCRPFRFLMALSVLALLPVAARSQESAGAPAASAPPAAWAKALNWRSIGPAAMGGRITSFAVNPADPYNYWVGTASGGVLKTTDNGTTFQYQFEHETTSSIGAVCVAPSDPNVVWVGTGENNPRNSVSFGDGVYKSVDGGKSWKNMGLRESFQIGAIAIHPSNPNIVYVGALGRLWGRNPERGLFKTADGGKTWQKVLFVNDRTGVISLAMSPADPETLLVATWERERDGFDSFRGSTPPPDGYDPYDASRKWGPGGGIYKTTDGGKSFRKLKAGLPTNHLGRVGFDFSRKNPQLVYAIVDCEKIGMGTPPSRLYVGVTGQDVTGGVRVTNVTAEGPAAKAGLKAGDLITTAGGKPLTRLEDLPEQFQGKKAGDSLAVSYARDGATHEAALVLQNRPAGGGGPPSLPRLLGALGEDVDEGVRLTRIFPEGEAEEGGLREGDVIQGPGRKPEDGKKPAPFDTAQLLQYLAKAKPGEKVSFSVLREGQPLRAEIKLEDTEAEKKRPWSAFLGVGQPPNIQNQQGPGGQEYGGVYRSEDAGETWTRVNSLNPRPMYFSQVRVDPTDDRNIYVLGITMYRSTDGGKSFQTMGNSVHPDQHALWIDPGNGRHLLVGCDGGFYVSYDRGAHWDHLSRAAIGQFYHVALDSRQPYRVAGGLQDNGSWLGPSRSLNGVGPINEDWTMVGGGDGFVCRFDPADPDLVYSESQDGNISRRNMRTGERHAIRPRPQAGMKFRFNWNTPFLLSAHNPHLFYSAGNYVFRSFKQGDDLRVISPEISRTGRGMASALAESPRNPDVLWVGTDDGNLWVTRDGGEKWTNVAERVGLPGPRWVASIEPSRFVEGRAYVAFDAHRSDDDQPYLCVTEDFGRTWRSIRANLPAGSTHCLREDVKNPNLLLTGTEFGAWCSLDRGESWTQLGGNLPTVPVHELAIHPSAGEVVAATHGRSLWVLDLTPLRQMTPTAVVAPATLYEPNTTVRWRPELPHGIAMGDGDRRFTGDDPPRGARIFYSLTRKAATLKLTVVDYSGAEIAVLPVKNEPGLQQANWDLSRTGRPRAGGRRGGASGTANARPAAAPEGESGAPAVVPLNAGPAVPAPAGLYRVVLTVDGREQSQPLRVENDPTLPAGSAVSEPDVPGDDEEEEGRRKDPVIR